jgi:hypothetical protein
MAKCTVDGAGMFDGATCESCADDLNWWSEDGAAGFLARGKVFIVVNRDEGSCRRVYAHYQAMHRPDLLFICEDPHASGYLRFNNRPDCGRH